jgi:hypothetical protein
VPYQVFIAFFLALTNFYQQRRHPAVTFLLARRFMPREITGTAVHR